MLHLPLAEHFLSLVLGELEDADEGEGHVEEGRIAADCLADVCLPHEGVDALPHVHEVALQLKDLLRQAVNYNCHLLHLLCLAGLPFMKQRSTGWSEAVPGGGLGTIGEFLEWTDVGVRTLG